MALTKEGLSDQCYAKMAEIRLKRSKVGSFIFATNFCRILSYLVQIQPMAGFLCAYLGEIRSGWNFFD
jgi:hypothetical protein